MKKLFYVVIFSLLLTGLISANVFADGLKYQDGDKYLKLGGLIQMQYHVKDDDGGSEDELMLRRLSPYIEGSVHKDWKGKFKWDMGKGKVEIRDAYFQYKGIDNFQISIGNHNFPFSRELLTSSKKQQLVERTFVGDHNYGTPGRQTGVHLTGKAMGKKLTWGASLCITAVDPSNSKLDFDTVTSLNKDDDWNEGPMIGGRVDFFPIGNFESSQGDFKKDFKLVFGLAAFTWSNDEDNLSSPDKDVDTVTGIEVSAAMRGFGLSVDAQYNNFASELVDSAVNNELYEDSETTLQNYAIEAGFMVVPSMLEIVGGYQAQDADGYDEVWTRTSVGINYYLKKHDIKFQVTYRMGSDVKGKKDDDLDEIFVQTQYVF